MAIFAYRLTGERCEISKIKMLGKFAGAVGNYNAHLVAYPDINWPQIAKEFVTSLGISFNPYVPQASLLIPMYYITQFQDLVVWDSQLSF